jgi:hypothetical protein
MHVRALMQRRPVVQTNYTITSIYILVAILVVVLGLGGFFVYPLIQDIRAIQSDVSRMQPLVSDGGPLADVQTLRQDSSQTSADLERLSQSFVDQARFIEFISAVERVGNDAGVLHRIIDIDGVASEGGSQARRGQNTGTIRLSAAGSFSKLVEYLIRLEQHTLHLQVQDFSMSRSSSASTEFPLELTLSLQFYNRP